MFTLFLFAYYTTIALIATAAVVVYGIAYNRYKTTLLRRLGHVFMALICVAFLSWFATTLALSNLASSPVLNSVHALRHIATLGILTAALRFFLEFHEVKWPTFERRYYRLIGVNLVWIVGVFLFSIFTQSVYPSDFNGLLKLTDLLTNILIFYIVIRFTKQLKHPLKRRLMTRLLKIAIVFIPGFIFDIFNQSLLMNASGQPVILSYAFLAILAILVIFETRTFILFNPPIKWHLIHNQLVTEHGLTPREVEIAEHLMGTKNNKEIAQLLFIENSTLKRHIANIFKKINVQNRDSFQQFLKYL